MAEPLVIEVRVTDQGASATLRKVRGEVDAVGVAAGRAGRVAGTAGAQGMSRMEIASQRLQRAVGTVHTKAKAFSAWLGGELVTMARRGALGITLIVGAIAGFGLKAASGFQQARIAFDTLLGSAAAGKALFAELQKINLTTPFQLGEIAPATQLLLRYGVAASQVVPTLKSLLDAAALSGDPANNLQKLSLAVGQIVQKGKLEGQEARQLAEAGIDAYGLFAEKLGVTRAEAIKMGQAGKLSADVFLEGLQKMEGPLAKLQGGAEKMSGTLMGQLSNLKDAINVRLAEASAPLVESLTAQIPAITEMVGKVVDQVGPPVFRLVGLLAGGLQRILPIVAPLLAVVVDQLGRLMTAAGPALTALQPLSGEIGRALVELVDALIPVMPDLVDLFIALVMVLPEFIRLLASMVPLVTPIANLATTLLGYEPVRKILAGLLVVLLGYRALSGVVAALYAFSGGLMAVARGQQAVGATAGVGGLGAGGKGARYAAGAGLAALALSQTPVPGENNTGKDLGYIATGTAAGATAFGPIGAAGGAAFTTADVLGTRLFTALGFGGDVDSNLARSSRVHGLAAGMTPGRVPVTSTVRGFGVTGPNSGHVRGTAWDSHPDFPQTYANNIRRLGGFATIHDQGSGRHVHSQIGDAAPVPGGGGWDAGGGGIVVPIHIDRVYGQVDFEKGVARGVERGLERKKLRDIERGRIDRTSN